MGQETVHIDESGAVSEIDISIINEKSVAVSIFRMDPNTFEEVLVVELGSGEEINIPLWVTDCLVAKIGADVVGEFGVSEDLREWRLPSGDPENGRHCRFLVENHRAESVRLWCTAGEDGETLLIQILDPGVQIVLDSFSGDFWEAMIGDQVVSAYQPSARLPVWEIDNLVCDFVPNLKPHGNENLNETSEPRRIDQPAIGEVKAVMVFVDFPDVPGTASPDKARQSVVGESVEWFRRESYGRLRFSVDTPVLEWRRMPRAATAYETIGSDGAAHASYITTALRLFAAEEIDFAQYQIAYIVAAETPRGAPYVRVLDLSPTLSAGIPIATNNGMVHHAVTFGRDSYHRGFRVLVHETGHLFGLPDLYRFHPDTTGEWLTPTGAWDIMCDLDHGWHFLGWHKYKLGWLDESQLVYFSSGELTVRLTALESAQGVKMIVLPSEHSSQLYIVEIAQPVGDNETFRDKGLLIYAVDASVATGHEPVSVLRCGSRPEDLTIGMRCNDFVAPGESHIVRLVNGERVEVVNRERHGADFEVTVVSTSAEEPGDREPIPCRICQDAEARSIWVRTT
jgi:M6 family metalloprotease-like protein